MIHNRYNQSITDKTYDRDSEDTENDMKIMYEKLEINLETNSNVQLVQTAYNR